MTTRKLHREKPYDLLSKALRRPVASSPNSTGVFLPSTSEKTPQPTVTPLPEKSTLQPVPLPIPGEAKATFKAACLLTHQIDCDLGAGRLHYRNQAGLLLATLDQVVRAIIDDQLLTT